MLPRTPITLISGPLGSGKTTLLRHILQTVPKKMAILVNEFGEISIDSKTIEGKNIRLAELEGGCVCCSLLGEFEAAVEEVIDTVDPEIIVVETTGVAEPDALIFDIQESLSRVRLDGVITVIDADAMIRYPQLGHTIRMQIDQADILLLNKIDLVSQQQQESIQEQLSLINGKAPIVRTLQCRTDPDLFFGIAREKEVKPLQHLHQPEFESFSYTSHAIFRRGCFEHFAENLSLKIYRAKGFVTFAAGTHLFNFVAGRWVLEPFPAGKTVLVFIGRNIQGERKEVLEALKRCQT